MGLIQEIKEAVQSITQEDIEERYGVDSHLAIFVLKKSLQHLQIRPHRVRDDTHFKAICDTIDYTNPHEDIRRLMLRLLKAIEEVDSRFDAGLDNESGDMSEDSRSLVEYMKEPFDWRLYPPVKWELDLIKENGNIGPMTWNPVQYAGEVIDAELATAVMFSMYSDGKDLIPGVRLNNVGKKGSVDNLDRAAVLRDLADRIERGEC